MNSIDRYQSLLDGYQRGIYTDREVIGQVLDMLVEGSAREALWRELTLEHRDEITQFLTNYDESAPPLLPHEHWRLVKEGQVALRRWFMAR
ncbi:hypothetical protein [Piscinibacter terrae]|uniref:Uncharacterized protein n=1 Tax=Piscinibacter terrae TaxID=2496871 RepID=A0A3N7JW76_9BURK|nr:hypothetical protein [Albitalea terrae]RQP25099.1 hypothetical protein DZC73_09615 [Albitalea terrae]